MSGTNGEQGADARRRAPGEDIIPKRIFNGPQQDALQALIDGAPRTAPRVAQLLGRPERTIDTYCQRLSSFRPDLRKAEARWACGDTLGANVETAIAYANARKTPMKAFGERVAEAISREAGEPYMVVRVADVGAFSGSALPAAAFPAAAQSGDGAEDPDIGTTADVALAEIGVMASRNLGQLLAQARAAGGAMTKAQLDATAVLLRLLERYEASTLERAAGNEKRSDEEVAKILRKVDERIVELAHDYAERLVAEQPVGT